MLQVLDEYTRQVYDDHFICNYICSFVSGCNNPQHYSALAIGTAGQSPDIKGSTIYQTHTMTRQILRIS
jgi:hypothetical protein